MKIYDIVNEGPKEWIARKFADRAARKAAEKAAEAALKAERELVARELEQYAPHIEDLARQYAKDIIKAEKRLGERPLFRDTGTPPGASPIKKDWLDDKAPELAKKDPAVQEAIRRKIKERADELEGIHTGRIKPETKPPEPEVKTEPKVKKEPEVKNKKEEPPPTKKPDEEVAGEGFKLTWTGTANAVMALFGMGQIVRNAWNEIADLKKLRDDGTYTQDQYDSKWRMRIERAILEMIAAGIGLRLLKLLAAGPPAWLVAKLRNSFKLTASATAGEGTFFTIGIASAAFWNYVLNAIEDPENYNSTPMVGKDGGPATGYDDDKIDLKKAKWQQIIARHWKDSFNWLAWNLVDTPLKGAWDFTWEKGDTSWLVEMWGEFVSREEANKRAQDQGSVVPPPASISTAPPAAELPSEKQSGQDEVKPGWQRAQDDDEAKAAWEKLMGNK